MARRCFGLTRSLNRCGRIGEWRWFCDEHKRQPIIWAFFIVFTVLGGAASIYSVLISGSEIGATMEDSESLTEMSDGEGWIKISNSSDVEFNEWEGGVGYSSLSVSPVGVVTGVVSDPKLYVFVLTRLVDEKLELGLRLNGIPEQSWGISPQAVIDASGNWSAPVSHSPYTYYDFIYKEIPKYDFWEIMAIAAPDPEVIEKLVTPQTGNIYPSELRQVDGLVCSRTTVKIRTPKSGPWFRIDRKVKPRDYCFEKEQVHYYRW